MVISLIHERHIGIVTLLREGSAVEAQRARRETRQRSLVASHSFAAQPHSDRLVALEKSTYALIGATKGNHEVPRLKCNT